MTNTAAQFFLALVPASRRERAVEALQVIEQGRAAGSILNVDFQDAKRTLDRAVDEAWGYGRGSTLAPLPKDIFAHEHTDLQGLHNTVNIYHVRDAIAASKKLAKTKVEHAWVVSARAFVAAVLPVALEMEALKCNIVKGRRPPTAEVLAERAAREASKVSMDRATCGCCFGNQAVLPNGRIHDHGYTLPSSWNKTASCYGRRFRPLEVSDEGPAFMVDLAEKSEKSLVESIKNLAAATTLSVVTKYERRYGHRIPVEYKDIDTTHPEFKRIQAERIAETEYNLSHCRRDLAKYRKVVAEWKPGYNAKV